jgi:NADPH-dependent curcumin reductase CurA
MVPSSRSFSAAPVWGIASAHDLRDQVWQHLVSDWKPCHRDRIANREITLEQLPEVFERMLAGDSFGRTIVRVGKVQRV